MIYAVISAGVEFEVESETVHVADVVLVVHQPEDADGVVVVRVEYGGLETEFDGDCVAIQGDLDGGVHGRLDELGVHLDGPVEFGVDFVARYGTGAPHHGPHEKQGPCHHPNWAQVA